MIGKILKVSDYKFVYGQDTVYINVFGAFKSRRSGNRYIVYSYDNKKLYCGSLFTKSDGLVIMTSKDDSFDDVKEFVNSIIDDTVDDKFEVVSLDKYSSAEIIDQHEINIDVDIQKLYDKTIPKPEVRTKSDIPKRKKTFSIPVFVMFFLIISVTVFLFINPEVIVGENEKYICTYGYNHDKLPAQVVDNVNLEFNNKKEIVSIKIATNYIFNDHSYYAEFRDEGYFSQYKGDSYQFDDENYTYKVFTKVDTKVDYFMPKEEKELIDYYKKQNYTCTLVKESK